MIDAHSTSYPLLAVIQHMGVPEDKQGLVYEFGRAVKEELDAGHPFDGNFPFYDRSDHYRVSLSALLNWPDKLSLANDMAHKVVENQVRAYGWQKTAFG